MKRTYFTQLLTLVILMVIGAGLLPQIEVADQPRPRQGKTLTVWYGWPGSSAKVIEQNVTSRLEGMVSAVKGVQEITSESYFGSGRISITLKPEADVSMTKFEIASVLRQAHKQLPKGVSFPELSGGEVVNESQKKETTQMLLTYCVNSNLGDDQLKNYMDRQVIPQLNRMEEVKKVELSGGTSKYIVITYDPFVISGYGLTAYDIEKGIKAFLGKADIVGEVQQPGTKERKTLYLMTDNRDKSLEHIPIGITGGKTIYLNDLASYEYKDRLPNSYFRVNGLNSIYMNIHVDAEANKIGASKKIKERIKGIQDGLRHGVYLTLTYDAAEEKGEELDKLVWRSLLSLFILMLFVWLTKRSINYLGIMAVTLAANILIAVIAYYVFDIRLHIYSLAGITVSLGMVIDAAIVMVDHYSYYHDRKAFLAILAALLTTIASLIIVMWLPDFLQKDLYDFAWIIIINLSVALIVAWMFVSALIEQTHYHSRQQGRIKHQMTAIRWSRFYHKYVAFTQKRKWIYFLIVILAFGIPFHALPSKWNENGGSLYQNPADTIATPWYEKAYNATLGSRFFQGVCKKNLSKWCGGTMRLFAESLSENRFGDNEEKEKKLTIRAQMPLGGTASQLNEKVVILENFLSEFEEIERFETRVGSWGALIVVEFEKEHSQTSFPYILENKVISKVITIGGADWSTSGISERGFSNSLNLQYRAHRIEISGYNYDRLYRIAEDMCREMGRNNRVTDLAIETPGHRNQEDELYMRYDKESMALYDFNLGLAHNTMREILSGRDIERYRDRRFSADMYLKSSWHDRFDHWFLNHSYLKMGNTEHRVSDFMSIEKREAKNCIPRKNQEYILHVAFNLLGSYSYTSKYIKQTIDNFNKKIPLGYKCYNSSYGFYNDTGSQYWLLGLIVVIIFFVCSILFESLKQSLAIVSLIPVSFIGTFLTYYFSGVEFGSGGFASMVLLAGLTVNAGIYILCEFNNQRKIHPNVKPLYAYIRAYNHKITAIFLTILSSVLGLVPFLIDGQDEPFWFSFAVGSCGGLLFSIIALIFVLPVFVGMKGKWMKRRRT